MSEVVATISAIAFAGGVVGTITGGDRAVIGKKIFLRGGVPGESVSARITSEKERYCQGELISVLSPSPDRVTPPCTIFNECGGCDLQHMGIAAQRRAKLAMATELFRKQGKIDLGGKLTLAGEDLPAYRYRRRATLHVSPEGKLGFFARASGRVVPFTSCHLLTERLDGFATALRALPGTLFALVRDIYIEERSDGVHAVLFLRESKKLPKELATALSEVTSSWRSEYKEETIQRSALHPTDSGSFSQGNEAGNELLQRLVTDGVPPESPVTELYAGGGNFTFPLAARSPQVDAVEVNLSLVDAGNERAKQLGMEDRVRFYPMSTEQYLKRHSFHPTVVLDPPRDGARAAVVALRNAPVNRVVYVSCNLPSLVRDCETLVKAGFTIEKGWIVDMFAQTHHLETVLYLSR